MQLDLQLENKFKQQYTVNSQHSKQKLLIVGDFNCKIGTIIDGNKEEVTVGGKILRKMMTENKLTVVNSLKCTKGLWTREQGDSKSIIDFVITKTEDETVYSI